VDHCKLTFSTFIEFVGEVGISLALVYQMRETGVEGSLFLMSKNWDASAKNVPRVA
jgi:hypothetical protein